jgi:deoxycytidylate deaminase
MMQVPPPAPPMRAAIKASKKSSERFKIGAAISNKNKVLAVGHNKHKTHTKYSSGPFCTTHAEGDAIRKAVNKGVDLLGKTLFVYRKNCRLSKPCPDCEKLARDHGIKKVVYSVDPGIFETLILT